MPLAHFLADASAAGCPRDQVENFLQARLILQPRQLAASAAARLCDHPDGPTSIGYGGARGGGKSHWLIPTARLVTLAAALRAEAGRLTGPLQLSESVPDCTPEEDLPQPTLNWQA